MSPLVPCPACRRHVRASSDICPFCASTLPSDFASRAVPAATRRLERLATFTFAASLAAAAAGTAACGGKATDDDGSSGGSSSSSASSSGSSGSSASGSGSGSSSSSSGASSGASSSGDDDGTSGTVAPPYGVPPEDAGAMMPLYGAAP